MSVLWFGRLIEKLYVMEAQHRNETDWPGSKYKIQQNMSYSYVKLHIAMCYMTVYGIILCHAKTRYHIIVLYHMAAIANHLKVATNNNGLCY